jgi:hypothetical protein
MTVTDTLDPSFTYASYSGTNWSCSAASQVVTCTNDSAIAQGSSYPTLTINVNVAANASGNITNSVTASGAGVSSTSSNSDSITIAPAPVLAVSKSHTGTFTQGSTATWTIQVTNNSASSSGATSGATVTVQDTLPSGYTMASYTGTGWTCAGSSTVTCTSTQTVAGAGGTFPLISLTVNVPANSPTSVSNTALAWGGGDSTHTGSGTAATSNSDSVTVVQAPASIAVSGGGTQSATISTAFGTALSVTVEDAGGNSVQGVTVTFTAPASGASGTFSNSSNTITVNTNASGIASESFTANSVAGGYSVSAAAASLTSASFSLTNNPGAATHFSLSAPGSVTAGSSFSVTVTAQDASNNTATGYPGTVQFSSSDVHATLPGNTTLTHGVGTFSVTLKTAGSQSITATDMTNSSIVGSASVPVNPGPAVIISVTAPASTYLGSPISFTVTAYDLYSNVATGYGGTVTFTSTDAAASLPGSSAITNGTGTFSATFYTAGNQTITATDAVHSLTATTSGTVVTIPNLVVTTAADDAGTAGNCTVQTTPGTGTDAVCSLRDALLFAANAGSANISFDSTVFAATNFPSANTIHLNRTLNIPANTSITGATSGSGATLTNQVRVAGAGAGSDFSVFTVGSGVTGAAINNLTIINGNTTGSGGGINNIGALTVSNSTVSGNSATSGGGIYNSVNLTLSNCSISGNHAPFGGGIRGGGIFNAGTMTVSNSTFSGNGNSGTTYKGGGIYNAGTMTVSNSTFSGNGNSGTTQGGGIDNESVATVTNSTFSGNTASSGQGFYNDGQITIANNLSADLIANPTNNIISNGGNVIAGMGGVLASSINLSTLGNYGGPTQTMLPLPGSAAICAGTATPSGGLTLPSTDQRGTGYPRTNSTYPGYTSGTACVDAGAVQTNYAMSFTTQPPASIDTNALFTAPNIPAVTLTESGLTAAFASTPPSSSVIASSGLPAVTLSGTTSATLSAGVGSFSGLTLSSAANQTGETLTATLSLNSYLGTPLSITSGSNTFNVIAITLSPTSLSSGTVASSYSQQITASNGTAPYTYAVTLGSLPAGLTLTPSGVNAGLLSGTPTAGGTFNFTITATDSLSNSGSQAYTLNVSAPTIIVTPATMTSGTYGASYNQSVSASGGTASYAYALAGGSSLPPGLTLNSSTGAITGTPSQASATAYTFTIIATDSSTGTGPYSGSQLISLTINQANATINITPYTVTYDATAHTATGTATGVGGVNLASDLTLSGTTHTSAGTYATDGWSFTDPNGNYAPANGTVSDKINQANAVINVTPYTVTYDGNAHTATGTATGVGGANLNADLTLSGTTHTPAGTYASDGWSFTDPNGNYAPANGTVSDKINQANAVINVTPYTVTYDGNAHTATGTATGVGGINLAADLTLSGTTHATAGTYATDGWSFTDPNGNYAPANGTITDTINKAASAVVLVTSLNPILLQNPVTYTATVTSTAGKPTGTATFQDGGVAITTCTGVAVTTATGVSTCAVTYTATGTHNITALYNGDANFLAAGPSNTVPESAIDINLGSPTSGTGTGSSQTILPGGAATYSFPIAPSSGTSFPLPVTFTVTGLPTGATASLAPSAWGLTSNNPWSWTLPANTALTGTTVLTIQIPQTIAAAHPAGSAGGNLATRLAPFSLALLLLPFVGRLRKTGKRFSRMLPILLLLAASLAAMSGLSGCGSNTGFFAQAQRSYPMTVTVSSGSLSHTSTLTLTVE